MNSLSSKDAITWSCEACHGKGVIQLPTIDIETPFCVVCTHCDHVSAHVWCVDCQDGGQITETGFTDHPKQWICRTCKRKYTLPDGFYTVFIRFTPERFPRRQLFPVKRQENELPDWLIALEARWKRFGEPFLIISMFMSILSLVGLAVAVKPHALNQGTVFFYIFLIVFSSLAVGMLFWGATTLSIKWIVQHSAKPNIEKRMDQVPNSNQLK